MSQPATSKYGTIYVVYQQMLMGGQPSGAVNAFPPFLLESEAIAKFCSLYQGPQASQAWLVSYDILVGVGGFSYKLNETLAHFKKTTSTVTA